MNALDDVLNARTKDHLVRPSCSRLPPSSKIKIIKPVGVGRPVGDSYEAEAFNIEATFNYGRAMASGLPLLPGNLPRPAKAPTYAPSPAQPVTPRPPIMKTEDCIPQCDDRCSLSSRKNVCTRACMTCCVRCKCIPPGSYGNAAICGKCYAEMTTHGNKSKCP